MEMKNLLTFSIVAELQSFSKAASQLGYAQSTVTLQIKQLEDELNTFLFERIGKNIYLTETGADFLKYANDLLLLSYKAKASVSEKALPKGKLRLGVVGSICVSVLPPILLRYHTRYPSVQLIVKQATTLELIQLLKADKVDMILTMDHRYEASEWIKAAERTEQIVFLCGPSHLLAHQKNVSIDRLLKEKFILTEEGCNYRYQFEENLTLTHKKVKPYLEIGNTAIIQDLIATASAVTLLPRITVAQSLRTGKLAAIDVEGFHIEMWSQLFYHKNKWATPAMQEFIHMLKKDLFSEESNASHPTPRGGSKIP